MGFLKNIFGGDGAPSERQIRRALKQATQVHGDPTTRVAAMERLAAWKTPGAVTALLRRFTVQVPQASMDQEEKQYTVRLMVENGRVAIQPILHYIRTESEVTYPVQALREILPAGEFTSAIQAILDGMIKCYSRWSEAKVVLIEHLPDESFAQLQETVIRFLNDDDDDVCIAAIDYLARNGDDAVREGMLELFLDADARPRVRGRILGHFCERDWPVKGYRKRVEEVISEPYYLTSKGTVRRRDGSNESIRQIRDVHQCFPISEPIPIRSRLAEIVERGGRAGFSSLQSCHNYKNILGATIWRNCGKSVLFR